MSQFGGKDAKRHFTVVMGGKEHGLYVSSTPSSAAKKAVTKLCAANKGKKVEFHIREITQGSKKKTYGPYEGHIEKLKEPIELKGRVIKYKPVAKLSSKSGAKKGGMRGGVQLWITQHNYIFTNQLDKFIIFGGGKERYSTFVINFNDLIKARDIFDYLKMFAAFDYAAQIPVVVNNNNRREKEKTAINDINGYLSSLSRLSGKFDFSGKDIYIYIENKDHDLLEKMKSVKRFIHKFNNLYVYDSNEERNLELTKKFQEYQNEQKKKQNLFDSVKASISARNTARGAVIDP